MFAWPSTVNPERHIRRPQQQPAGGNSGDCLELNKSKGPFRVAEQQSSRAQQSTALKAAIAIRLAARCPQPAAGNAGYRSTMRLISIIGHCGALNPTYLFRGCVCKLTKCFHFQWMNSFSKANFYTTCTAKLERLISHWMVNLSPLKAPETVLEFQVLWKHTCSTTCSLYEGHFGGAFPLWAVADTSAAKNCIPANCRPLGDIIGWRKYRLAA